MTAGCADRLRRVALALAACPILAVAAQPPDWEGHFAVSRNGSPIGEAETVQSTASGRWRLENRTEGTQGSARLLGFEEHSLSTGTWWQGVPSPDRFSLEVNTVVKDVAWTADFDWTTDGQSRQGVVTLTEDDDVITIETTSDTLDPLSAGLRIRLGLMDGEGHWTFPLVDSDEIEGGEFRAFAEERLDTALGCLVTRRVEKVRAPESKRYTRTWYAKDHGWAPVKVEHGKTGGNHMETRVLSLSVEGRPVPPGPACADG